MTILTDLYAFFTFCGAPRTAVDRPHVSYCINVRIIETKPQTETP